MANGLTFEQRWFAFIDWCCDTLVPPFCAIAGAMFIFMSYYGENLYWMADAFQWGGVAMILLGMWWAAEVRFRTLESRIAALENLRGFRRY